MAEKHTLSSVAMQLAIACDLCTLSFFPTMNKGLTLSWYPFVLLPFSLLVYFADRLLLRRERPLAALIGLNTLLAALFAAAVFFLDRPEGLIGIASLLFFSCSVSVSAGQFSLIPPTLHMQIVALDLTAALLLIFTGCLSVLNLSFFWALPVCTGCACALIGVISRRVSRRLGRRDWSLLLLVFSALSALLLFLVHFVAAPAGQGFLSLWKALVRAVKFILLLFWNIFVFLLSFMPEPEGGSSELPAPPEMLVPAEAELGGSPIVAVLMLCLLAAAAILMLCLLLAKMGKLRIGGRTSAPNTASPHRQKISLWRALRRLLSDWKHRIRTRLFLWKHRNTPEGLFYTLVRRFRVGPWRKKDGETPREFLTRLRAGAGEDASLTAALDELIPAVDAALFSPAHPRQDFPHAALIRRRIGGAAQRQYLQEHLSKKQA